MTLERGDFIIPTELAFGKETIVPLAAGETLKWRVRS
jgi:dihydroorotase